jgi:cytochrome c5
LLSLERRLEGLIMVFFNRLPGPVLAFALVGVAFTCPACAAGKRVSQVSAHGATLRSTSVTLPAGDALYPGGKAADVVNGNCLSCHSTEMVLTQPKLTRAQWQTEVTKMIKVYKAPVNDGDVPAIVDYLSTNPGLK